MFCLIYLLKNLTFTTQVERQMAAVRREASRQGRAGANQGSMISELLDSIMSDQATPTSTPAPLPASLAQPLATSAAGGLFSR